MADLTAPRHAVYQYTVYTTLHQQYYYFTHYDTLTYRQETYFQLYEALTSFIDKHNEAYSRKRLLSQKDKF
jgi:hypothetical protein